MFLATVDGYVPRWHPTAGRTLEVDRLTALLTRSRVERKRMCQDENDSLQMEFAPQRTTGGVKHIQREFLDRNFLALALPLIHTIYSTQKEDFENGKT